MSNELEAFIEYITVIKALSKKSIQAYKSDLYSLEKTLNKSLIELDSASLFSALAIYKNRRTLNRKLSSVNAFFDFCYKNQFMNEKNRLKFSKVPKLLPKFLSYSEIQSSLKQIDKTTIYGLRDYALILFLYATGTRISECLALRREDIDGEWLYVRHAKGEKERIIPIAHVAKKAVDDYLNEVKSQKDFVWFNYKGGKLSRISAYKITQKYLGVSPHVIRHSYATSLIRGGADLRVVQELLGHASLLTTQIYTHIQKQDLKETVEVCHPMAKEYM
ncbi:MAG: integrase [Sulfurimonas sp. RIFOXYD12_FULL_33_39]|uniref:tyrosine-type recombinase/integrase n=1 Tax=unclassified Sulfurimonas TaxID=2623549 RepID=UPI0008D677BB|nr:MULTISPECIES: tyrosine-type recombinase/integrase [unclassified Sulfurimonas]OHE05511.1 MAG: integrase [Sulfurimonas sp. RIFCSPLOWO2_12_FULL_34_6]OHE09258.1 MAG: integrase [Sulfurimonas sp. RIFOXYD12_FULL_33_39]OHE12959.1 MAG: integrase [Sulfurimonas sp. RIFOXYD2_FULL_34_21]DAB27834.1 MAG TPA: integrase [Sulfurimonas sp. UBA10385]